MSAIKHDQGKVEYSDIPPNALESVAKVFNYGAKKYAKFNYNGGMEYLRYYDAAIRHMQAWVRGQDIDESSCHHIDHAIASLLMLRENIHLGTGTDNRFKPTKHEKDNNLSDFKDEKSLLPENT